MESLKQVNISVEDLDEASKQIGEEINKFCPWRHGFTEHQNNEIQMIVARIILRKVRELFGKPLPPARMRSPRMSRK